MIDQWDHEGFGDGIVFAEVAEKIGMPRKDFNKRVARDPRFKQELAQRGYDEVTLPRQSKRGHRSAKGIARTAPASAFAPDPEASYTV
ncbi:hypothetical protein Salmuc_04905 [Salipiger mucosus DSM 16094]|uniref:Uncharacterized protein n=1 Tax=Salipiger mucosus DSM 16094 TaxID=1123237 RepID=S9R131_9RHOB|nr:hypothetical protein Salmuc_04905 [Salipiger mucosus DSM 16094]